MKTCTKCLEEKEANLEQFAKDKKQKDGLSYWCRECHRENARRDYHNNRTARRASNDAYTKANRVKINEKRKILSTLPETKKRLYEEKKRYREKYADQIREKKAAYYQKNREREQAKARARYQANPDYFKENARKRKNRLKSTVQEPYTKKQIYERDKGLCFLCIEPVDLTLKHPDPMCFSFQHAMPLIHGGHDTPDNVLTSHLVCNLRQGTKPFKRGSAHL